MFFGMQCDSVTGTKVKIDDLPSVRADTLNLRDNGYHTVLRIGIDRETGQPRTTSGKDEKGDNVILPIIDRSLVVPDSFPVALPVDILDSCQAHYCTANGLSVTLQKGDQAYCMNTVWSKALLKTALLYGHDDLETSLSTKSILTCATSLVHAW